MRWAVPPALLVAEYVALSLLVDFPTSGPAMRLVSAARMLVPAAIGAGAAGWLIARRSVRDADAGLAAPGPWRPALPLVLHLAAFGGTAFFAVRLFGSGVPVGPGAFAAWFALVVTTVLLSLLVAAPARVLLRAAREHLRVPLLAAAVGLLSWRAVAAAEGLWGVLQAITLQSAAALLRLATSDVFVAPAESVVGAGGFDVEVAPVCSGVDGLGLVVVFQAVWMSFARSRVQLGRALLLLLPLGALAALGANAVRIAVLVLLGAAGREDLAMGAFHSKLGWILFVAIALASVALVERFPWVRRRDAGAAEREGVPPAAGAYVAPLVAALVVALLTSLWAAPALDRAYALRIVAALAVLAAVRRALPSPSLSVSWPPLLVGAAVGALWVAASGGGEDAPAAALAALGDAERIAWIAARVLGSCLVVPVVEELAFRGFLLPWLVEPDFESAPPRTWTWPAVLLSSLAFGALHREWLLGTLAGVAFAAMRAWRGRLGDAILAHATANAVVAAGVLLLGRWGLWS